MFFSALNLHDDNAKNIYVRIFFQHYYQKAKLLFENKENNIFPNKENNIFQNKGIILFQDKIFHFICSLTKISLYL